MSEIEIAETNENVVEAPVVDEAAEMRDATDGAIRDLLGEEAAIPGDEDELEEPVEETPEPGAEPASPPTEEVPAPEASQPSEERKRESQEAALLRKYQKAEKEAERERARADSLVQRLEALENAQHQQTAVKLLKDGDTAGALKALAEAAGADPMKTFEDVVRNGVEPPDKSAVLETRVEQLERERKEAIEADIASQHAQLFHAVTGPQANPENTVFAEKWPALFEMHPEDFQDLYARALNAARDSDLKDETGRPIYGNTVAVLNMLDKHRKNRNDVTQKRRERLQGGPPASNGEPVSETGSENSSGARRTLSNQTAANAGRGGSRPQTERQRRLAADRALRAMLGDDSSMR